MNIFKPFQQMKKQQALQAELDKKDAIFYSPTVIVYKNRVVLKYVGNTKILPLTSIADIEIPLIGIPKVITTAGTRHNVLAGKQTKEAIGEIAKLLVARN